MLRFIRSNVLSENSELSLELCLCLWPCGTLPFGKDVAASVSLDTQSWLCTPLGVPRLLAIQLLD